MTASFSTADELSRAIAEFSTAKDKLNYRRQIIREARRLGHTDLLPASWNASRAVYSDDITNPESMLVAKSESSGLSIAKLRCVYVRGVAEYEAAGDPLITRDAWAQARVNSFIRLSKGLPARADDIDLLPMIGAAPFREELHPRDRRGRFIDKLGTMIKIFASGTSSKHDASGRVEKFNPDGSVDVLITGTKVPQYKWGQMYRVDPGITESLEEQARLGVPPDEGESNMVPEIGSNVVIPGDGFKLTGMVTHVFGDQVSITYHDSGNEDMFDIADVRVVSSPGPGTQIEEAPRDPADFSAWGDRAAGIEDAYHNRPSLDHMISIADNKTLMLEAQKAFGGDIGGLNFDVDVTTNSVISPNRGTKERGKALMGFSGEIYDLETHQRVGDFTRTIIIEHDGTRRLYNNEMKLDYKYQGQGAAAAYYKHVEDWAIANGITDVRLDANIDIGGYAWARAGFDWDEEGHPFAALTNARRMLNSVIWMSKEMGLPEVTLRATQLKELAEAGARIPHPVEIAHLGWHPGMGVDDLWPGKRALMGEQWAARKILTPANVSNIAEELKRLRMTYPSLFE